MTRLAKTSRNYELVRGVNRFSRSSMIKRKRSYVKKVADWKVVAKPAKVEAAKTKAQKFYPAEVVPRPLASRKNNHRQTKLRSSIKPGTVLIILAGRFRGKRVIFVKQLPSGLLLVTGPYKVNGVPARRVNQAYVIATSTVVDISKVKVPEAFTDAFFKKSIEKKVKKTYSPKKKKLKLLNQNV